jgi:hypothetical protein
MDHADFFPRVISFVNQFASQTYRAGFRHRPASRLAAVIVGYAAQMAFKAQSRTAPRWPGGSNVRWRCCRNRTRRPQGIMTGTLGRTVGHCRRFFRARRATMRGAEWVRSTATVVG